MSFVTATDTPDRDVGSGNPAAAASGTLIPRTNSVMTCPGATTWGAGIVCAQPAATIWLESCANRQEFAASNQDLSLGFHRATFSTAGGG
jgi:hypothetical protein